MYAKFTTQMSSLFSSKQDLGFKHKSQKEKKSITGNVAAPT